MILLASGNKLNPSFLLCWWLISFQIALTNILNKKNRVKTFWKYENIFSYKTYFFCSQKYSSIFFVLRHSIEWNYKELYRK